MIKLKGLKKKLLRLEASLQKNAKKLAKLKRKVEIGLKMESEQTGLRSAVRAEQSSRVAKPAAPPAKKKRALTAAGREKLSALMKARWAAKRAGNANGAGRAGAPHPVEA